MKKLDRSRPLGEIFGSTPNGARYIQDGVEFDGAGNEIGGKPNTSKSVPAASVPSPEPEPEAEPEPTPEPEPAAQNAGTDYSTMKAPELKALVTAAGGEYSTKKDAVAFLTAQDAGI